MNYLAGKLLKLRKHYNYSQRFVADVLGIDVLEYMGFENGRDVLHFAQLKTLARFYHIPVSELFYNRPDVTLYDISNTHTDELNIEYFLPKDSKWAKIKLFFKQHLYWFVGAFGVLIILFFVLWLALDKPDKIFLALETQDRNRLDASDTSVVYIDNNGVVKGSGDNTNGQLNLDYDDIVKVEEGSTFTVVLNSSGQLDSSGLMDRHAEIIRKWNNIVDFACGDGHIIALDASGKVYCTGDNMYGQCDFNGFEGVKDVFATDRGSVIVENDGSIAVSGEFFGRSSLGNYENIQDLDSSDTLLTILQSDGSVDYYSTGRNYNDVPFFNDIVDVACGNDFIAALDSGGKVHIDIDNYLIQEEVESWENVIAIAAGKDYLVGYDGHEILGVGKNTYKQFEVSEASTQYRLPAVRNLKAVVDGEFLTVQFDSVANARAYLIEIDVGTGFSAYVEDTICMVDITRFEDGRTYTITVTALGEGEYADSASESIEFTYHTKTEPEPSESSEPTVDIVEIPFALDQLVGKTKTNFEIYLQGLGIGQDQLTAIESENICEGEEAIIESVTGISDYETVTRKELLERKITYTYCKVENS